MSRRGRPSKLTAEVQVKICDALRAGNHRDVAADFAGVDRATFHRWLRRGAKATSGPYRAFSRSITKAFADAEARDVALIGRAATEGNWKAAAWRLERTHPDRWGRQDRIKIESQVKAELDSALSALEAKLSPEEYERVLAVLADGVDNEGARA